MPGRRLVGELWSRWASTLLLVCRPGPWEPPEQEENIWRGFFVCVPSSGVVGFHQKASGYLLNCVPNHLVLGEAPLCSALASIQGRANMWSCCQDPAAFKAQYVDSVHVWLCGDSLQVFKASTSLRDCFVSLVIINQEHLSHHLGCEVVTGTMQPSGP